MQQGDGRSRSALASSGSTAPTMFSVRSPCTARVSAILSYLWPKRDFRLCRQTIGFRGSILSQPEIGERQQATRHADLCQRGGGRARWDFRGRAVGDLVLRGRVGPMRAYEPLSLEEFESPAAKAFAEAFAKLEARDPGAVAAFAAVLGLRPSDTLAQYHLKRLLNGAMGAEIAMP
jgi:hypothetical protein